MLPHLRQYLTSHGALEDKRINTCLRLLEDEGVTSLDDECLLLLGEAGIAQDSVSRFGELMHDFLASAHRPDDAAATALASYAGRNAVPARRRLNELAATCGPALAAVALRWPAPLAHEFHRLHEELLHGSPITVLWQLDDCYEMTLKFLSLALAADLLQHGEAATRKRVRQGILKTLSGGAWTNLWTATLVRLGSEHRTLLALPQLVDPARFWAGSGKGSFPDAFSAMIAHRNATKGHGALGYDQLEQVEGFAPHLGALARFAEAGLADFDDLHLTDPAEGTPWLGWQMIRARHDQDTRHHADEVAPLSLVDPLRGASLELAPLIAQRRCLHCARRDVFLFDSFAARGEGGIFYLLDHLAGHRMSPHHHEAEDLGALLKHLDLGDLSQTDGVHQDAISSDFQQWMVHALEETRYLPPRYLFEPVQAYLSQHGKGLVLLSAPAMVGKSVFAANLENWLQANPPGRPDITRWVVKSFAAKRGVLGSLDHFENFLDRDVLEAPRDAGGIGIKPDKNPVDIRTLRSGRDGRPGVGSWTGALALRLGELQAYARNERLGLVIAIDGLDELPADAADDGLGACLDAGALLEVLPDDCYLVLTSRPAPECGAIAPVVEALERRLDGATLREARSAGLHLTIHPDRMLADAASADPLTRAYRTLLETLYEQRLTHRVKAEAYRLAGTLAGAIHAGALKDDFALIVTRLPRSWRQAELLERWRAGLAMQPQRGAPHAASARTPGLEAHLESLLAYRPERLLPTLLERAMGRFGYLEHIVRLLEDGIVPATRVDALPRGEQLYTHYLSELHRLLEPATPANATARARSPWQDIIRVLCLLAAEERAYQAELAEVARFIPLPDFSGISLAELAGALDLPEPTYTLLKLLIQLRPLLATYRPGNERFSKVGLGVRDLMESLAGAHPAAIESAHRQRFGQLAANMDEAPLAPLVQAAWHRSRYTRLAAATAHEDALFKRVAQLADASAEASHNIEAIRAYSASIASIDPAPASRPDDETPLIVERMRISRTNALAALGQHQLAIQELDELVDSIGAYIDASGEHCPPAWRDALAAAYVNRGVARRNTPGHGALAAIADYDAAIDILRTLVEALGEHCPPAWRNDLANACLNRGNARQDAPGHGALTAIADYDAAIDICLTLVDALGERCPPAWRNDLAAAYMNRGNARQHAPGHGALAAIADYDAAIDIRLTLLEALGEHCPPAWRNNLAAAYVNRGNARQHAPGQGALTAIADYDAAIDIRLTLVEALGERCPPAWRNDLAAAYMNRGNAKYNAPGHGALTAIADYDDAIDIRLTLVEALGEHCPPAWRNDLAAAYMNRGVARQDAPGHGALAAIADYDAAIDIGLTLVEALGEHCPPAWRNDLAKALRNRARAYGACDRAEEMTRDLEHAEALAPSTSVRGAWWFPPLPADQLASLAADVPDIPTAMLDTLRQSVGRSLDIPQASRAHAHEICSLPHAWLIRLHCTDEQGRPRSAALLAHRDATLHLDGTAAPLHFASGQGWCRLEDAASAADYLRLFCNQLSAQDGVFRIVETPEDLPWSTAATRAARQDLAAHLLPLAPHRNEDGSFETRATVLFGGALFAATLRLKQGQVEMLDDEPLMSDLPVHHLSVDKGWFVEADAPPHDAEHPEKRN